MTTLEIIGGIAAIVTIIGGAVPAIRAGRRWLKSRKHNLSKEEIDILLFSQKSVGVINILEYDQTGIFVQISDRKFFNQDKPEYRTSYLEALDSLINRHLVCKETEKRFYLTKTGVELARKLINNHKYERQLKR